MKLAIKLVGITLLGLLLSGCGGGSATDTVVKDDTTNNGSTILKFPHAVWLAIWFWCRQMDNVPIATVVSIMAKRSHILVMAKM